ncbi:MAG: alpha/beta fold hydrolase [Anaerolineae bacterium]|nr:alpha/beta fold hydrolase [Anaerolineae bacterium]
MQRRAIDFISDDEKLVGELVLPAGDGPHPAVLLIGGTFSDTRDGDPALSLTGKMPAHGMFRVMAERLAAVGIASLRWDKRGVGESTGGNRQLYSDLMTDVEDASHALQALCSASGVNPERVAVLGESAGAHVACLLAARTRQAKAFVLQGALYDSLPELMEFNYNRLQEYCARGPEAEAWVKKVAPGAYQSARHWRDWVAAAQRGDKHYQSEGGQAITGGQMRRLQQELTCAPADQFHYIQTPVLVIQGDCDLNVPPDNCLKIAAALRAAGNPDVTLIVMPGADHSMQLAAQDPEIRLRERISFESFYRPFSELFLTFLATWLTVQLSPPVRWTA